MTEEFNLSPHFINPGDRAPTDVGPTVESRGPAIASEGLLDAHALAAFVAKRAEVHAIIHIGGHANPHPMMLPGVREICIDLNQIVDVGAPVLCDGVWIGTDVESGQPIQVDAAEIGRSVIICANAIERLNDPGALLVVSTGLKCRL